MFAMNELGCRRGRRKDTGNFCAPRALNPFMYRFMALIGGYWLAGRGGACWCVRVEVSSLSTSRRGQATGADMLGTVER